MTSPSPPQASDWSLIKRIWPFVTGSRGWLWVVLFMIPIGVACDLALPLLLKSGIDDGVLRGDTAHLGRTAAQYLGVILLAFLTRTLGMYGLQIAGLRALARLRSALFKHVMGQGQRFFDRRHRLADDPYHQRC